MKDEMAKCSVCGGSFERDVERHLGKLVSCPAHSFGEVEADVVHESCSQEDCQCGCFACGAIYKKER